MFREGLYYALPGKDNLTFSAMMKIKNSGLNVTSQWRIFYGHERRPIRGLNIPPVQHI